MALWQRRFGDLSCFFPPLFFIYLIFFFVNASKSVKHNAPMSTFCDDDQRSYEISSLFWSHNLFSPMSIQSQRSRVTQSSEFLLAAPEYYWCFLGYKSSVWHAKSTNCWFTAHATSCVSLHKFIYLQRCPENMFHLWAEQTLKLNYNILSYVCTS